MKNEQVVLIKTLKTLFFVIGLLTILFFAFEFIEKAMQEISSSGTNNRLPFGSAFSVSDQVFLLIKNFILFMALFGMSILVLIGTTTLFTILLTTIFQAIGRSSKKVPETMEEQLRLLIRQKPRELFVLSTSNEWLKTYTYEQMKQQWMIRIQNHTLTIEMKNDNELLIHAQYDFLSSSFLKKNISTELAENKTVLKRMNKLLHRLAKTDWKEPFGFRFISNNQHVEVNPLNELESNIKDIIHEKEMQQEFQFLVEHMNSLHACEHVLDIETKHLLDYSLLHDLNRLLFLYKELNDTQKESMKKAIQERLGLMNEKVSQIKEKVAEKKIHEIQLVLQLFDQRYQKM